MPRPFDRFEGNVKLRAAVLALVAVLLLLASTALDQDSLLRKLLETAGAALLVGSVVDVLLEGRVRRDLSREFLTAVQAESGHVLRAVGLNARLSASGVLDVSRQVPDWDGFLCNAAEICLLPLRPADPDQEWAAALQVAQTRRVTLEVHLPSDSSPHLDALAERIGDDVNRLRNRLEQLPAQLVEQWQSAAPRAGCELRICTYDGVPAYGFAATDQQCAVLVPAISGARAGDRPISVIFESEPDDAMSRWRKSQLRLLDSREYNLVTA